MSPKTKAKSSELVKKDNFRPSSEQNDTDSEQLVFHRSLDRFEKVVLVISQ